MSGANGNAAPASSPVNTGEVMLEFGVAAVEGKVVVRFNKLIQWFEMEPALAVAFAESVISQALEAQQQAEPIIVRLPGLTVPLRK